MTAPAAAVAIAASATSSGRGTARRAPWLVVPLVLLAGLVTGLVTGCAAEARPVAETPVASPFADCGAVTKLPPSAPAAFATVDKNALPDLELPCFTGGAPVKLNQIQAPAVINLWASWCEPCRTELPAMQELADRAAGRLTVIGVNTADKRDSAASFAADNQITLPTLVDPDQQVLHKLGRMGLPVTVFLGDHGSWHVEPTPLDDAKLDQVVRQWTGVAVPS